MRIYISGRYSRLAEFLAYRDVLHAAGHLVTSRWLDSNHELVHGRSVRATDADRERIAEENLDDIEDADATISFTEPPDANASRGGRHAEFGASLIFQKRLIVIGFRENVFHHLPCVEFYPNWPDFVRDGLPGLEANP